MGRVRPHTNLRWLIGLLLGFGILINYFDRVNLSVAHPAFTHDFGLTDVEFGYLSSGFAWTYAILQIPVGIVLDRYGVLTIGRVGAFFWASRVSLRRPPRVFGTSSFRV